MIEALNRVRALREEARRLDALVISGRVAPVQRNIQQIEGKYRSDNFVRRLAGISGDVYRKSVTERTVEFYGATVLEHPELALRVRSFFDTVLLPVETNGYGIVADFWTLEENVSAMLSSLRTHHVANEAGEERLVLMKIRDSVEAMLELNRLSVPMDARARE